MPQFRLESFYRRLRRREDDGGWSGVAYAAQLRREAELRARRMRINDHVAPNGQLRLSYYFPVKNRALKQLRIDSFFKPRRDLAQTLIYEYFYDSPTNGF